jgi:uncharacterized repeat protein (TIGR04076 family)
MTLRVRCTVESFNYSACGLAVGDSFQLSATGVTVPKGRAFCYFAVTNAIAAVQASLGADVPDDYLAARPVVMCPDTPEDLRIRVEVIDSTPLTGEPS